jgi:hypothetical protein
MRPRGTFFNRYKPPAVDGRKAVSAAVLFLTRVRSLDHLTIETFAHTHRLKTATAQRLMAEEAARRG